MIIQSLEDEVLHARGRSRVAWIRSNGDGRPLCLTWPSTLRVALATAPVGEHRPDEGSGELPVRGDSTGSSSSQLGAITSRSPMSSMSPPPGRLGDQRAEVHGDSRRWATTPCGLLGRRGGTIGAALRDGRTAASNRSGKHGRTMSCMRAEVGRPRRRHARATRAHCQPLRAPHSALRGRLGARQAARFRTSDSDTRRGRRSRVQRLDVDEVAIDEGRRVRRLTSGRAPFEDGRGRDIPAGLG